MSDEEGDDLDPLTYPMNNKYRGVAIIFGYSSFRGHHYELKDRSEVRVDVCTLGNMLVRLGFQVIECMNKTKHETFLQITHTLTSRAAMLQNSDCLIAVFLSYGADGAIFAKDLSMRFYEEVLEKFNGVKCPALIGKPKFFIVQTSPAGGTDSVDKTDAGSLVQPEAQEQFLIPSEANSVIIWNPLPAIVESSNGGSLFVNTLCDVIQHKSHVISVPSLIREAIRRVSHVMQKHHPKMMQTHGYKLPYMINMLTKEFTLAMKLPQHS